MGLDIYLYKYENFEETTQKEKLHRNFDEKLWEGLDYNSLSQEEKDNIRNKSKEHAKSLGLDEWGSDEKSKNRVETNPSKYPDHYFKIGYFRSSYNDSGIERILGNLDLPTLRDIFDYEEEKNIFQPNWENSLKNINSLIEDFSMKGPYRVHDVSPNLFRDPDVNSEKEALEVFIHELSREKGEDPEMNSYTNVKGEFYLSEPLKVVAMIPGTSKLLGQRPCTYIVTESDNTWYSQALEIVRDTIQFVLDQEDKEKYYLHWSG
jgi:hypothetical protein